MSWAVLDGFGHLPIARARRQLAALMTPGGKTDRWQLAEPGMARAFPSAQSLDQSPLLKFRPTWA